MCLQPVTRHNFQLLGITCLWIAGKYEEVHPPQAQDMVGMTENQYSTEVNREGREGGAHDNDTQLYTDTQVHWWPCPSASMVAQLQPQS